jgi:hypothetical protein
VVEETISGPLRIAVTYAYWYAEGEDYLPFDAMLPWVTDVRFEEAA